jgi:hypothetical protein
VEWGEFTSLGHRKHSEVGRRGASYGSFALVGSIGLAILSTIQKVSEELAFPKTLALLAAVANIAYVSPNLATMINATTDTWYQWLNAVLTFISIVKGLVAIPVAASKSAVVKWAFPAVETTINIVWNVPVIMNIVVNKDHAYTTYKALIPESICNFAFNLGGIVELPIVIAKGTVKYVLIGIQDALMIVYGALMLTSGLITEEN